MRCRVSSGGDIRYAAKMPLAALKGANVALRDVEGSTQQGN